jgi:hypothetical protein
LTLGKINRAIVVVLVVACSTLLPLPSLAGTTFPTREDSLARPNVVVESGEISTQYRIGAPPNDTTYDLRGLTTTAYPTTTNYPLSFGKDVPGTRTVTVGATVLGQASLAATWQDLKSNYDGAALLMFGRDSLASYDLRADDVFDFFRPRPPSGDLNGATFLLSNCYGTNIRDDAIENDHEMTGTIRDCMFDGVSMGVSIGQNEKNPSAVTTIDDSTFIFRPFPNTNASDGIGHAVLFKQMGGGQVVMHNDLVCYPETPIGPDRLLNWMPGTYDNVTIVLGSGFDGDGDGDYTDLDYPGTLPPGVAETRDWSLCDAAVLTGKPPPPLPAPSITGVDPTSGPVGTPVTLTGSGFTGASDVSFNGVSAGFNIVSGTQVATNVPVGATTGPISVTTSSGTTATSDSFTVTEPPPQPVPPPQPSIDTTDPISGPVGAPVTLIGSAFTGTSDVSFNGVSAAFTVDSDTQITTNVPAGATTGTVWVTTMGGTATSVSSFTVTVPAPSITAVSPTSGPVSTPVTITGANLTGASAVSFNGVTAPFVVDSDTQITTSVPLGATTGTVWVTTMGGTAASPSDFSVTPPPTISSLSPSSGPAGTSVTITGSSLTGASSVSFNGVTAAFTVDSDTQITVTVPNSATTGLISVTTPGGTASSPSSFTVLVPSTLTFSAAADAYVAADHAQKNFGTATTLQVDTYPVRHTMLRFTVSGIGSRMVQTATLRLYCARGSSVNGGVFYPVANNSWGEKSVTWNTAPAAGSTSIASLGPVVGKTWVQVDLTSYITGDGTYSLRVTTPSAHEAYYTSREGTSGFRPQLVVVVLG